MIAGPLSPSQYTLVPILEQKVCAVASDAMRMKPRRSRGIMMGLHSRSFQVLPGISMFLHTFIIEPKSAKRKGALRVIVAAQSIEIHEHLSRPPQPGAYLANRHAKCLELSRAESYK